MLIFSHWVGKGLGYYNKQMIQSTLTIWSRPTTFICRAKEVINFIIYVSIYDMIDTFKPTIFLFSLTLSQYDFDVRNTYFGIDISWHSKELRKKSMKFYGTFFFLKHWKFHVISRNSIDHQIGRLWHVDLKSYQISCIVECDRNMTAHGNDNSYLLTYRGRVMYLYVDPLAPHTESQ